MSYHNYLIVLIFSFFTNLGLSQPVINTVNPIAAPVGATLTITGTGFSSVPNNNIVFFGAVRASVLTASSSTLTVQVPRGAAYGPISITIAGLTGFSKNHFNPTFFSGNTSFSNNSFGQYIDTLSNISGVSVFARGIAAADFNNDGRVDVAAIERDNRLFISTNNTTQHIYSFSKPPVQYYFGSDMEGKNIITGDVDGDGKLDIIALNRYVYVFRNTSSATTISFAAPILRDGGVQPYNVAMADLNNDGKPDLAVASQWNNSVAIFQNQSSPGNLSFTGTSLGLGSVLQTKGIAIGDIDGDALPDLAVACEQLSSGSGARIYKNVSTPGGAISFGSYVTLPGSLPLSVGIADIDGDTKSDVVLTSSSNSIKVFRNTSTATSLAFDSPVSLVSSWPPFVIFADFDGDGRVDIGGRYRIWKNTSSSGVVSFLPDQLVNTSYGGDYVAAADIDGDGKPEFLSNGSTAGINLVYVMYNKIGVVINSFSPQAGIPGSLVIIRGKHFTNATQVKFGGTNAASFTVLNDSTIHATVGGGASGDIEVITPQGQTLREGFIFGPYIKSFSPGFGGPGKTVTIKGERFLNATAVQFGGIAAQSFNVLNDTMATAIVGNGASGLVSISTPYGTSSSRDSFIFYASPVINSFTPTTGFRTSIIRIRGGNFNTATAVFLGDSAAASFKILNDTCIEAVVGGGASGSVTVHSLGGITSSPGFNFVRPPFITSFAPESGPAGSVITINGQNFDATPSNNKVTFGKARAQVIGASKTGLTVVVPASATYDPICVSTNRLAGFSVKPFNLTFPGGGKLLAASFADNIDSLASTFPLRVMVEEDVDGDGKLDIVAGGGADGKIMYIRNISTMSSIAFEKPTVLVPGVPVATAADIQFADLDGDGRNELIVMSNYGKLKVYKHSGASINPYNTYRELDIGNNPQQVFTTDLDADGRLDIIAAAGQLSVFRNLSNADSLSFSLPTALAGTYATRKICLADFNNDGKLDIISNYSTSTYVAFFSNASSPGQISFQPHIDINLTIAQVLLAAADLDGDNRPDLITANSTGNLLSVIPNTTTGTAITFGGRLSYSTEKQAKQISLSDLDGDGKCDLSISSLTSKIITVFKNLSSAGTIQLAPGINKTAGKDGSSDVDVIDIVSFDANLDGKPDIFTINRTGSDTCTISGFRNRATEPIITSFSPTNASTGETVIVKGANFTGLTQVSFGGVAAISFTILSDTIVHAVVGAGATGEVTVTGSFGSHSSAGFTFGPPVISGFTPLKAIAKTTITITGNSFLNTSAVLFGGKPALSFTVVNQTTIKAQVNYGSSGSISVVTVAGTANAPGFVYLPAPVISSFSPSSGYYGSTVTITGSGFDPSPSGNIVYFGATRATVLSATEYSLQVAVPAGATYAPINVTSYRLSTRSNASFNPTFPGGGVIDSSTLAPKTTYTTLAAPAGIAVTDMDGDGKSEVLVANSYQGTVSVFKNNSTWGTVSLGARTDSSLHGYSPLNVITADLDGDGKRDVLTNCFWANSVAILKNLSTPNSIAFAPLKRIIRDNPPTVVVADFDGDGKPDFAIPPGIGAPILNIYRNNSNADSISFLTPKNIDTTDVSNSSVSADFDRDGKPDIMVLLSTQQVLLYRNTSTPANIMFEAPLTIPVGPNTVGLLAADVDMDGRVDMIVQRNSSNIHMYRNIKTTSGSFSSSDFANKVEFPISFDGEGCFADIDGDGKPDYISTGLYISKNNSTPGNISFAPAVNFTGGFAAANGTVNAGDLDNDGKPDVIVTQGENYSAMSIFKNAGNVNLYMFTGNGSWHDASNWLNGLIPPNPIPPNSKVEFSISTGMCTFNGTLIVSPGAFLVVPSGVILNVSGGVIVQ